MMKHYVRLACFVGGTLFGSAGVKLLTSKDAKKAYTHITAAGLRMKDSVMETVTCVQENAVVEEAKRRGLHHEERHAKVEYLVAHGIASSVDGEQVCIGSAHFIFPDCSGSARQILPPEE